MPDSEGPLVQGVRPVTRRRLDSWKAIADYLGRHVTTVQRWEHEEGLPVHRHQHDKRGSVYGYAEELDEWLAVRSVMPAVAAPEPPADTKVVASRLASLPDSEADRHHTSARAWTQQTAPIVGSPSTHRDHAGDASLRRRGRWLGIGAVVAAVLTIAVTLANEAWSPAVGDSTVSLAVLPLENGSPDQQPDYFVDGITEALTTDIASLTSIRVIARQSAMRYRGSRQPASVIARELGADALVEGAVQRSGSRVRLDIRLIDGATSRSLWAATYERDIGDTLALQADISRAIVNGLHLTVDPSRSEQVARRRPSSSETWDAYLRARFHWNRRTHDDMSRAIRWYERAIELDASSPLVFAGLADVFATLGPPDTPIAELIARGTTAAEAAIALDPSMGEPYAALGKLRAYAWDWRGAEQNYQVGIERAPRYAPARYWYGSFLANQGRCSEAFVQAHEAELLDPVSLPGNVVIAGIEMKCGRLTQAISRSQMILEFDPTFGQSYESLGRAHMMRGDAPKAIAMFQRALELTGGRPTIRAGLAHAYASVGRAADAEEIATDLTRRHTLDKVTASAWSAAIAHAGLKKDEAALSWLEHAYEDREEWLEALAVDERFTRFHSDPRFQHLLVRLGLSTAAIQSRHVVETTPPRVPRLDVVASPPQ